MNITLYSNNCPRCKVLKAKLEEKNISHNVCADIDVIIDKGFRSMPILEINNKTYDFSSAIQWVLKYE